jgi:hypothetical protein
MGNGLGFLILRRKNYVAFGHNGLLPGYQAPSIQTVRLLWASSSSRIPLELAPSARIVWRFARSIVKSKEYAAPLVSLSPELVAGMVTVYLVDGRFKPPAHDPEVTVPTETNPIAPDPTRRVLPKPSETDTTAARE